LGPDDVIAAGRLGASFRERSATDNPFRDQFAARCQAWNAAAGRRPRAMLPPEIRAQLRTEVGREVFLQTQGRLPKTEAELVGKIARWSKPSPVTVGGYDLSFSPPKSVSTLWALADPQVAALVERCHQAAVRGALEYLEQRALYSRTGTNGLRQVDALGLIGTAFTHRDSRAGDPDLHTHVAIANKVQIDDGRWLAIDGRLIYKAHVTASELYDRLLQAHLTETLGISWVTRPSRNPNRPVHEIAEIDQTLCRAWSNRRSQIETKAAELATQFRADHGRPPTGLEMIHLSQQANLATREAKHEPRRLVDQRRIWRQEADALLGRGGVDRMLHSALNSPTPAPTGITRAWIEHHAAALMPMVESERAHWQNWHVRAEALRLLSGVTIPPELVLPVAELLVSTAITGHCWPISPNGDGIEVPDAMRRRDGTSVYELAESTVYTSSRILASEQSLLATAARTDGRRIEPALVDIALLEAVANGTTLNAGQSELVRGLATSGARLQLAIAPAGSGKTTALAVLAEAWTASGGTVLGLAPSAAAAAVLGDQLDGPCDTLAKLAWTISHPGLPAPVWAASIGPETLVIIDEAGMADTPTLAAVVSHVVHQGGSVRLVGDDQQLSAVGAGGILTDIRAAHGAHRLDEVLRFTDPAEAAATLDLRRGNPASIGFYADNRRLHPADAATIADQVLNAWAADRHAGLDSIMLAATRDRVALLNHQARQFRLRGLPAGREVGLADGNRASAGDLIITRRNNRQLRSRGGAWVTNGDRWTVTAVNHDGSLTAEHLKTHKSVHLPADYVEAWTELGYATTIHGAQGVTADTCHGLITGTESRQQLYTMASRGRDANHLHIQTTTDGSADPVDLATLTTGDLTATLENVLARTDETTSATTLAQQATDPARQLGVQVARYADALTAAAEQHLGPDYLANLAAQADQLVLWLSAEPAWPTLRGHLIQFAAHGQDPMVVLRDALNQGDLGTADDPAAVLDWRIDPTRQLPAGPLPWLPGVPQRLAEDPAWGRYLTARAELVGELAGRVRATPIDVDRPPEWLATPREPMPLRLVQDVQVWRAATGTPDHDLRPTGGAAATAASAREQRRLDAGLSRVGMPDISPWWEQLAPLAPHIAHDPEIRQLAVWLDGMAAEGIDVTAMLDAAIKDGPLPVDHTLAALNYRLERHHPSLRYGWPPIPERASAPRPPRPDLPSHRPRPGRGIGF
jgi:conjugative relaxase-like TrwC/TraI family protein